MNRLKTYYNGAKNEDAPECKNRVRYIRESCKVLADLWKSDKDFLNKSVDNDIAKAFKEFRSSDEALAYRSTSILNSTIDDLIRIHEYIDGKRKELLEKFRTLTEKAKEKQATIRQTLLEPRENYERAVRKFESADSTLKKFQNRSDRTTVPNFEERYREYESNRAECDQARAIARDTYATETYRIASEEHSITLDIFAQYLFDEQNFYNDIQQYLSNRIPDIKTRLEEDKLAPSFQCDISEHCVNRIQRPIAYPIETCIRLLKNSVREEGLFRIGPSQRKQKKFVAELDLQLIDEKSKLQDIGYNSYVVASALKQYLRELPDCLLTDALLPQWNEIPSLSNDEIRVQRIGQLINQLPKVNYDNLCYLIRFLSRVAECSSENKMTASNLGICIGCSLLYPKVQSSNSYINSSSIIELMIIHYKQLFPEDSQQDLKISTRSQPDIIPTGFQSKNNITSSNESLDIQQLTEFLQPSPKTSAKHRAPPPPPIARSLLIQLESSDMGETSTEQSHFDQITESGSPTLSTIEKDRRLSGSTDRLQYRSRRSTYTKELENSSTIEENDLLSMSPVSNDGNNISKLVSDLNARIANSNVNSGQTSNNRISSSRGSTQTSTGEITQF